MRKVLDGFFYVCNLALGVGIVLGMLAIKVLVQG
jgi:hypothetical protein